MAPAQVLAEPAFDLLCLIEEVPAHRLHDHFWRQTRLWLFRDRHHYRERLLPRNLLRRAQKICDGIIIEVALIERGGIAAIEELPGVSDLEVDTRPPILGTISRVCRH